MTDSTNPRVMADNIKELSALSESQASNISTLQTSVEALGSYSKTEVDTGKKWINESPIYRKVFEVEALPNNTSLSFNHEITNLDVVVDLYYSAYTSTGGYVNAGRSYPTMTWSLSAITITSNSDASGLSAYVIIEYTKSAAPTPDVLPSPDPDTRSLEEPETEPEEPEPIEEKK